MLLYEIVTKLREAGGENTPAEREMCAEAADAICVLMDRVAVLEENLAMSRAASRAAACELARAYAERERLNEAVARIVKERDELRARYCAPVQTMEQMKSAKGGDTCGETTVRGNAGGTGKEAGPGNGASWR